jgi:hypothetical protein
MDINNLTEEQLHLLIHNCNVYGLPAETKQKYVDRLKELESGYDKDGNCVGFVPSKDLTKICANCNCNESYH